MYTPDDDDGSPPSSPAEKWSVVVFALIVLGLFGADIATNYQPVKLSALFMLLFWVPLMALHELAHAAMAHTVGWHVDRIVIGFGKLYWAIPLIGTWVEIRQVPISGYILPRPGNLIFPRTKDFLISFAGPASGLFVSLAVVLLAGPDRIFQKSDNYFLLLWQGLAIAGAAQAFMNFFPVLFLRGTRTVPNDGLAMLCSFYRPTEYYANMMSDEDWNRPAWSTANDPEV